MLIHGNKKQAYLNASLTAVATTVQVVGNLFSALSLQIGQTFKVKLENPVTGDYEIVNVTAASASGINDNLTIVRAQEGTTAQAFTTSATASLVATAETFNALFRRKNRFINGDLRFWEYGVSFTSTAAPYMVANRWLWTPQNAGTVQVTRVAPTMGIWPYELEPRYGMRINRTVVGTTFDQVEQRIHGVKNFAGGQCTVSVLNLAGGNSAAQMRYTQNFGTGGAPSGSITALSSAISMTSTGKYQFNLTIPSIAGKTLGTNGDDYLSLQLVLANNLVYDITLSNFQAEASAKATDFEVRPDGEELAMCRRFFWKSFDPDTAPAQNAGTSGALAYVATIAAAVANGIQIRYPVPMWKIPTLTFYNPSAANANWRNTTGGADSGAVATSFGNQQGVLIRNPQVGGDAVGNIIGVHMTADAEL